ncbi:MAG: DUF1919 domain-containing protein [Dorea sp.]|jgi:uncharacterized protein (DUF1919 family)|uniref:DUF1919 domain-containing protein n=1 Tax=Sporofaciens sp. JLR.KK001 TaxID=3112621 RepID=UPI00216B7F62|nr:DUF1919 domain-containing protein [Dorea sp.]
MQRIVRGLQLYERKLYCRRKKNRLKNKDFSIIASNCNGTFMYYDMRIRYLTPTVNLVIEMNDFVKLAENLEAYMEKEIVKLESDVPYPTGMLDDIKIMFMHYPTFEEGVEKWNERKKRINWENLFIVGTEKDGCTYETIQRFDRLPYENKVIFTHIEYPEFSSAYYIEGFEERDEIGVLTNYKEQFWKRRYLDDFDYVNFLNSGRQLKSKGQQRC